MASAMEMVCNTLGIDRVNMNSKVILIQEQHGTNANFLVNAILSHALKQTNAICLVLCHNTFGHYHNIGMRLGYNLLALKEKGQVTVVEPMKIIASNIADMCKDSMDKEKMIIPTVASTENIDIAHRLFTCVREKYNEAAKFAEPVVFIFDDINHLLDFGLSVHDVMYFISNTDVVANALKHMAHLCVTTQPFRTGRSSDASGKLIVHWRINSVRLEYHWAEKTTHLFKLLDWQVKIGAPGAASVLS
ncbi:Elongator complex protein 6 [Camponotus japonicus]